ncbi:MAG: hypothetical protein PHF37_08520 [Phycisphaerae bacterium]|nr:hypothetical protein [Phycisphaerae bacterium]
MYDETQGAQNKLVDTTDCLEAVSVFQWWKNILFAVLLLVLACSQGLFWANTVGIITTEEVTAVRLTAVAAESGTAGADKDIKIEQAAKEAVAADSNAAASAEPSPVLTAKRRLVVSAKPAHLAFVINFLNFILVPSAVLYCLTLIFSLKVSLVGRLGGINHIARAFFRSLLMVVVLMPWQKFLPGVFAGAIYTPAELADWMTKMEGGFSCIVWAYLRFTGLWAIAVLLLIFAQLRSARWSRNILKRLEVI